MRMSVLDPTLDLRNASSCVSPKLNKFEGFIVLAGLSHVLTYLLINLRDLVLCFILERHLGR